MSSPSSVLTHGLGSWGSVSLLVTRGLGVGAVVQGARRLTLTGSDTTARGLTGTNSPPGTTAVPKTLTGNV